MPHDAPPPTWVLLSVSYPPSNILKSRTSRGPPARERQQQAGEQQNKKQGGGNAARFATTMASKSGIWVFYFLQGEDGDSVENPNAFNVRAIRGCIEFPRPAGCWSTSTKWLRRRRSTVIRLSSYLVLSLDLTAVEHVSSAMTVATETELGRSCPPLCKYVLRSCAAKEQCPLVIHHKYQAFLGT